MIIFQEQQNLNGIKGNSKNIFIYFQNNLYIYRFNKVDVKERVKGITDQAFSSFNYSPDQVVENGEKANELAMKIRDVIQNSGKVKRYKINVQVYLGEKKNQRVTIVAKGWWDSYLDNYVTYTYQGPNFYCTVIVWGFYTD